MSVLTEPQRKALVALQRAQAGGSLDSTVHPGWGHRLTTMRALERLGLCTIKYWPATGYVRRGRWVKVAAAWTAAVTHEGICRRVDVA